MLRRLKAFLTPAVEFLASPPPQLRQIVLPILASVAAQWAITTLQTMAEEAQADADTARAELAALGQAYESLAAEVTALKQAESDTVNERIADPGLDGGRTERTFDGQDLTAPAL